MRCSMAVVSSSTDCPLRQYIIMGPGVSARTPLIVAEIFKIIKSLKEQGMTILLVEQMANQALSISDRAYVLEVGSIVMEGAGQELLVSERVRETYLGKPKTQRGNHV